MEYLVVMVGLVLVGVVALSFAFLRPGKGSRGPLEMGRKTAARRDRPRAEKEQMDAPQEEFVNDADPPSRTRAD